MPLNILHTFTVEKVALDGHPPALLSFRSFPERAHYIFFSL